MPLCNYFGSAPVYVTKSKIIRANGYTSIDGIKLLFKSAGYPGV